MRACQGSHSLSAGKRSSPLTSKPLQAELSYFWGLPGGRWRQLSQKAARTVHAAKLKGRREGNEQPPPKSDREKTMRKLRRRRRTWERLVGNAPLESRGSTWKTFLLCCSNLATTWPTTLVFWLPTTAHTAFRSISFPLILSRKKKGICSHKQNDEHIKIRWMWVAGLIVA